MANHTYDAGDLSTDLNKVRFLIGDKGENDEWILSDEEIQAFIDDQPDIWHAAAACCIAIASSNALLSQAIRAGAYSEDYSTAARELRAQAKTLIEASEAPYDETAEMATTDFALRQMLANKALREG
ncbi:hypothetical protein AMJ39_09475 [candidate division TA06 bacterium DG_24]|uniref:Uncharacterized protein n=1 Tax=candidate division TA06 bacterium DG_24 TaxID=1703770 RepID=A0A0S7WNG0_UNCT6|nr:MAG: hypothetical protein AMJ39_09475 [candidate division TA06 bacterium DG_24]